MMVSAPGNVILLGEYAVLEEGGRGVAFAVSKRVRLHAEPAPSLSVPANPLVSAVLTTVSAAGDVPALSISIDSSELYLPDGRKAGFGSSAAVAVALVSALRRARPPDAADMALALAAHRMAQGGVGSGYDVCCSFFGGWGMFTGGARPSWKPHDAPQGTRVYLFAGPAPVATRNAIQSFFQWKADHGSPAQRLIRESNANVMAFLAAGSAGEAAAAFRKARATGILLGDEIGVQARIPAPPGVDPELCKAVGAGNELGAYLHVPGAPEPAAGSVLALVPGSESGVTWTP